MSVPRAVWSRSLTGAPTLYLPATNKNSCAKTHLVSGSGETIFSVSEDFPRDYITCGQLNIKCLLFRRLIDKILVHPSHGSAAGPGFMYILFLRANVLIC